MYNLIRSILFLLPPESAHKITLKLLHVSLRIPIVRGLFIFRSLKEKSIEFSGITFPNKIGIAAGFDKNAAHIADLAMLGFGHIEVGTVTPLAQPGNDKPRLFRLPQDQGLINRMGFNNDGVDAMVANLKAYYDGLSPKSPRPVIGGNIGKNKVTPNDRAVEDYKICYRKLFNYVDYFVINVSSPNTPNLRELQDKGPLKEIIESLLAIRTELLEEGGNKPLLLKIAPDLTDSQLDDVIEIAMETGLDGLIATNTTISRDGLKTSENKISSIGPGGLSGAPVRDRSTEVIQTIHDKSEGKIPVIGVGGILSASDAQKKLDAGATLVQVYTGFIYGGPKLVKDLGRL